MDQNQRKNVHSLFQLNNHATPQVLLGNSDILFLLHRYEDLVSDLVEPNH